MAARRSFTRSMGKFVPQIVVKPIAILTACRGILLDPSDHPYPELERRRLNDEANELLKAHIRHRGLSYYPVVGAGQEEWMTVNKENSLVVQPVGQLTDAAFIAHIQQLLFNPTDGQGAGPFVHTQWGALMKLPSNPQAFTLFHTGQTPTGPQDYSLVKPEGDSAQPRVHNEPFYTQMKFGPRADPAMMDPLDRAGDVGNIDGQPGKRFCIIDGSQP